MIPCPVPPAPDLASLLWLALIQGISEFLPISSDGHLVLAQSVMGMSEPRLAIDVALHLGTLVAVLIVFRRDLGSVAARALGGEWSEVGLLLLGSIPAAVVGLGLKHVIEPLFSSGRAAALGLLVTAGFLWAGERSRLRLPDGAGRRALGWRDALWIGTFQALAILPGISRSGTTIATALVRGVEGPQAARFSFLLSIPAVAGAVLLEVPDLLAARELCANLAWAVLLTAVVGVLALRFLLAFLGRGAFRWCALYCVALGAVALLVV